MNPISLEVFVVTLGIAMLMLESFVVSTDKRYLAWLGIAGLAIAFGASFFARPEFIPPNAPYASFYTADGMAMFFKRFSLLATILVLVMTIDYTSVIERFVPGETKGAGVGEFLSLPVLTCAGLMWMVSATDFIAIFVSLELVTISFYVLVAYLRRSEGSLEAGTKYLILGALSTGFIVYGITWIFGVTGRTNLAAIAAVLPGLPAASHTALLFGVGLVLVALCFKVAAFPFQFWVPDVYQGAPTPITAFLSVGSKAAGFIVLLRVLQPFLDFGPLHGKLETILLLLAGATLIYGNLSALPQRNLKRLLSYSSVGHAGYLFMAVASLGVAFARPAIEFYLSAYLLMTFLAFIVMALVSRSVGGDDISHFAGLARRSPWLAGAMLVAMLSLAGIPFTAGFMGKLFIFGVAIEAGHYWLVVLGALTVACGFYYYLLVVRAMYWQAAPEYAPEISVSLAGRVSMGALALLIFIVGIYPQSLLAFLG
ncbi:MAG: NADH-quinone oxidoreductase subunit N [Terrimicrobiaceae bacterium]|nr:NADH-quinone oxidoreductase subunit N [Terrimicrobiaceae bacterium]